MYKMYTKSFSSRSESPFHAPISHINQPSCCSISQPASQRALSLPLSSSLFLSFSLSLSSEAIGLFLSPQVVSRQSKITPIPSAQTSPPSKMHPSVSERLNLVAKQQRE